MSKTSKILIISMILAVGVAASFFVGKVTIDESGVTVKRPITCVVTFILLLIALWEDGLFENW